MDPTHRMAWCPFHYQCTAWQLHDNTHVKQHSTLTLPWWWWTWWWW